MITDNLVFKKNKKQYKIPIHHSIYQNNFKIYISFIEEYITIMLIISNMNPKKPNNSLELKTHSVSAGPISNLELKSTKSDNSRTLSNTKPRSSLPKLHVNWKHKSKFVHISKINQEKYLTATIVSQHWAPSTAKITYIVYFSLRCLTWKLFCDGHLPNWSEIYRTNFIPSTFLKWTVSNSFTVFWNIFMFSTWCELSQEQ